MSLIDINGEITAVNKVKEANKSGIRILHEFDTNTVRKGDTGITSEAVLVRKYHEVNRLNKDVSRKVTSKCCDSYISENRRRHKKSATVGTHIYIECVNKENNTSNCISQETSVQSWKKQKVDSHGRMSFKSFAEQYTMYAASVAGKEDLENLRNSVRSKAHDKKDGQENIALNSCFKTLREQKSAGFTEQQNDIEKCAQPICNDCSRSDSNIMRTPSTIYFPLSGIKKLVATPDVQTSQIETTTILRSSGDASRNFQFNKPRPVFGGVVAFVDVRSELFDHSQGIKEVMLTLGAKVKKTFSRQVSHVIFKDGTLATYSKAKKFNIPLISVLWVEACRREQTLLPCETFVPFGLEKYDTHLIRHTGKVLMLVANWPVLAVPSAQSRGGACLALWCWDPQKSSKVMHVLPSTLDPQDRGEVLYRAFTVEQYPTENTRKYCTCVKKQSISEIQCDDILMKHQNSRCTLRSQCKTSVLGDSFNKENTKLEKDLCSSCDEIIYNKSGDGSYIEKFKGMSTLYRKSAPPTLMTIRKSKQGKICSKEVSKSCRKKLEIYKTEEGVSSSLGINVLKTQNYMCQISVNDKNESEKCHDNCRFVYKNDVQNENCVLECDRQIKMCNKADEAQGNRNSGADCVNKEVIVGCLKPATVKKRKRKLLPLETSICIGSPLECTTDKSLCSPYYELTPCQDTSGVDKPVLVSGSRGVISKDIALTDKEKLEVHSFLRKESCALFIENKLRRHDFCQRLMATVVCTSMTRKDVEEVESVVHKLGRFRVENKVSYRTTHVVTCKPRRTMNLLKGIARGCWILSQDWVIKSGIAEKWLNEERFELTKFSPAVKQCRLERQAFGPVFSLELFGHTGMIYVSPGTSPSMLDLIELLQLCGGNIVNNVNSADIIIGKDIWQLESAPLFVSEKWILDSVTRNTQLDPHRYKIVA